MNIRVFERKKLVAFFFVLIPHTIHFMGVISPFILLFFVAMKSKKSRFFIISLTLLFAVLFNEVSSQFSHIFGYSYYFNLVRPVSVGVYTMCFIISGLAIIKFGKKWRFEYFSPYYLFFYNLFFLVFMPSQGVLYFRFFPLIAGLSICFSMLIIYSMFKKDYILNLLYLMSSFLLFYRINADREFYFSD